MRKFTRRQTWKTALVATALLSSAAWAHSPLISSTPSHNQSLRESPVRLELKFKDAVKLVQIHLSGHDTDIKIRPDNTEANEGFSVDIPQLTAGEYLAKWRALGSDGHLMKGSIQFTVEP